jgi:hypothetical protein
LMSKTYLKSDHFNGGGSASRGESPGGIAVQARTITGHRGFLAFSDSPTVRQIVGFGLDLSPASTQVGALELIGMGDASA